MWNEPKLEDLAKLPRLYETEEIPAMEKLIYEHFFLGGCDWYACEFDSTERLFFGYAILHNDLLNSEFGYFALDDLRAINVQGFEVERDLYWKIRPAREVENIKRGYLGD